MIQNAKTQATTRLFGLVATQARTAVILRRGPSKQVRMLRWDLRTDEITAGQWLSGRVYNERCGISPDGELLIYFCGKFRSDPPTFTAICRPPYFTALAFWPDNSTWGGGGFFEQNNRVVLNYGYNVKELNDYATIPEGFEVSNLTTYRTHTEQNSALENQGWSLVQVGSKGKHQDNEPVRLVFETPWIHEKHNQARPDVRLRRSRVGLWEVNGASVVYHYDLLKQKGHTQHLGRLDWADWDHDGSLLFSENGCLYRKTSQALFDAQVMPTLVADLRDQTFKNILPTTDAKTWPSRFC